MQTALVAVAAVGVVAAAIVVATRVGGGYIASSRSRRSAATAEAVLRTGKLQGIADSLVHATVTAQLEDLHAHGKARVMRVSKGTPTRVGLSDGEIWHCYEGDVEAYQRACERNPEACASGRIRLGHAPAVGTLVPTSLEKGDRHRAEH